MTDEKLQLLVVEDDEDDFLLVRDLLTNGVGADVDRAASADQALERSEGSQYDAMLLDYRLGAKNGLDVLRALRQRDVAAPVIFLTGHGDEQIAVEAMKAGATDYLPKSKLNQPSLAMAVRYAVSLRHKEEAVQAARRALHASEQRFRALVENGSDIITLIDAEGNILYSSQSARRIVGWTSEEIIDTPAFTHVHPEDEPRLRELFRRVLESPGVPFRFEHRTLHKDGTYVVLESTGVNRLQEDAVRAVVINSRDVTERYRAEEALRQSEADYRALFENANDAIMIFEPEQETILEVNPKACEMYGFSREQLLGKSLRELTQDVERGRQAVRSCLADGWLKDFETVHHRCDGTLVYIVANASLTDYRGRKAILTLSRDVTESRNLQQQLLHAGKIEAVGQLAGGVAHDFNNLLMVIGSHAELLHDSTAEPTARRKAEEILEAVRRGASLTRQLLAFSRKQVLSPRLLQLNDMVGELGTMLPRMLGETIRVELRPAPGLWHVQADPAQIEQVIVNLAVNARDAMPHGGRLTLETANVEIGDEYVRAHAGVQAGSYVLLAVSDTGEGIQPDVLPHIFEPFFTTKEPGKGTGLGLATVYGIVQQSGGSIWVYSELARGTVFKIYLPKADAPLRSLTLPPPEAAAQRAGETVLLVEDEEAVRAAASEFLSLRGYRVLEAGNGEDALRLASAYPETIHVVISDVVMPGISGSEMVRRLKAMRPDTRVLFVSGYTESTVGEQGIDPAAAFLQKPFSLSSLAAKICELLALPVG